MKLFCFLILCVPYFLYAQEKRPYYITAGAGAGIVNFSIYHPISGKWLAKSDNPYGAMSIIGGIGYEAKSSIWEVKLSYRHWWTTIGYENLNPAEDVPVNGYPWPLLTSSRNDFRQLTLLPAARVFVSKDIYLLFSPEFSFHFHPYRQINRWDPQVPSMKVNEIVHLFDKAPSPFLFSISAGAGFKVNRFHVDFRYQQSLNNLYRNIIYRGITSEMQIPQSIWSVECTYQIKKAASLKNLFKKI